MVPETDSAQLAAIRGVLADFDWERDDRQYALEEIERILSPEKNRRAGFVKGLHDLADYLAEHENVPLPDYYSEYSLTLFADGDTVAEKRAAVDAVAAILGSVPRQSGTGRHYIVELPFGPVVYEFCATDAPETAVELGEVA